MKKFFDFLVHGNLMARIAIGIVIGALLGYFTPQLAPIKYLGLLFAGALKAIAPVLVFFLVASSISKAGTGIGKKFKNVVILYLLSTLISASIAVIANYLFPLTIALTETADQSYVPANVDETLINFMYSLVDNPVKAVAEGNYLSILLWSIVMGQGLKIINDATTNRMMNSFAEEMSLIIAKIIQLAPIGILGIVFYNVSENGITVFTSYGKLVLELVVVMLFVMLVSNPLIMFICTRKNPYPLVFTCLKESAIPAFFTRSSAANIPINMYLCKKLKLDEDFYSVSIPLGSTINMNGAAVVITIMSLTLACTLGIEVPLSMAFLLAFISTLGACGTSGVAGGSLLLIPMACSVLGIPTDISMQMVSVGFIISVIQDSMETALNSSADVAFTATADYMAKMPKKQRKNKAA